jgi:HPt (histidine-containing phosphotransfer) domain-containing protein
MEQRDRPAQITVNLDELLMRVENDRGLLCELIGIFKEAFPRLLQALQQAVAREDMKNVEATSHALKGMFAGLSVTRAAAIASQLEQMGREGETLELIESLALLER